MAANLSLYVCSVDQLRFSLSVLSGSVFTSTTDMMYLEYFFLEEVARLWIQIKLTSTISTRLLKVDNVLQIPREISMNYQRSFPVVSAVFFYPQSVSLLVSIRPSS